MIPRYRLLAARIRTELRTLERSVNQTEGASARAEQQPADRSYFVAAVAFELHSFYAGLERLFEVIGSEVDRSRPSGAAWHRELLAQMALPTPRATHRPGLFLVWVSSRADPIRKLSRINAGTARTNLRRKEKS